MRYLILAFTLLSFNGIADHRIDYGEGAHFVRPSGIEAGNNGDEIKESGCHGSIITNADGTRTGSVICKRKYAAGTTPIAEDYTHTSDPAVTNIVCNLDDTNNTYQTKQWTVDYDVDIEGLNDLREAFGSQEGEDNYDRDYDFNEDGIINFLDVSIFKQTATGKIKYSLSCFNGVQQ